MRRVWKSRMPTLRLPRVPRRGVEVASTSVPRGRRAQARAWFPSPTCSTTPRGSARTSRARRRGRGRRRRDDDEREESDDARVEAELERLARDDPSGATSLEAFEALKKEGRAKPAQSQATYGDDEDLDPNGANGASNARARGDALRPVRPPRALRSGGGGGGRQHVRRPATLRALRPPPRWPR